ncbi:MAG: chemotaxis protein CheR [Candidatus Nitrosocaldaceae archaeon]|nr:MAG: chemotaxis protein CheR [Candidatus Nitrosocaldaceae archaeon]
MNNIIELRDIILKHDKIDISQYNANFLNRRLEYRSKIYGLSVQEYIDHIERDESERKLFLKSLSINVTEFFRDKDVFDRFAELVNGYKRVNICSIGCATGEEPYTIAMITKSLEIDCKITAIDISYNAIRQASIARYPKITINKIPKNMLKYFDVDTKFIYIKPDIKKMVKFEVRDVFTLSLNTIYDFIFCRNMLIYFDSVKKNILIKRFHEMLKYNGYLILGKSEILLGDISKKFTCADLQRRIYRKV